MDGLSILTLIHELKTPLSGWCTFFWNFENIQNGRLLKEKRLKIVFIRRYSQNGWTDCSETHTQVEDTYQDDARPFGILKIFKMADFWRKKDWKLYLSDSTAKMDRSIAFETRTHVEDPYQDDACPFGISKIFKMADFWGSKTLNYEGKLHMTPQPRWMHWLLWNFYTRWRHISGWWLTVYWGEKSPLAGMCLQPKTC